MVGGAGMDSSIKLIRAGSLYSAVFYKLSPLFKGLGGFVRPHPTKKPDPLRSSLLEAYQKLKKRLGFRTALALACRTGGLPGVTVAGDDRRAREAAQHLLVGDAGRADNV